MKSKLLAGRGFISRVRACSKRSSLCKYTIMLLVATTASSAMGATTRYYHFETNNGVAVSNGQTITSADDSSGNDQSGTATGTPKYAATPFGSPTPGTGADNHFSLLNGNGHGNIEQDGIYIAATNGPILGPRLTVEAFFRLNSTDQGSGDAKSIFRIRDLASFPFNLSIYNMLDGSGGTDDTGSNAVLAENAGDRLLNVQTATGSDDGNGKFVFAADCSRAESRLKQKGSLLGTLHAKWLFPAKTPTPIFAGRGISQPCMKLPTPQRFPLGQIVATPGALDAFQKSGETPLRYLARHATGDWGERLCDEDKRLNDDAIGNGTRLLSSYHLRSGEIIWIITEADRSATTVLLPSEY